MNINLFHKDGTYPCKDLINIIIENGLELVSLTDHDKLEGVTELGWLLIPITAMAAIIKHD